MDSVAGSTTIGYIIATTNQGFTSWKYSQPIVSMISTTVMFNGTSFLAMPGYNYYQWMRCDTTGYTTIPNANTNTYSPTQTGDYAVLIINGTCNVITDCLAYTSPFGIGENEFDFYVYPNPNASRQLFFSQSNVEVRMTDLSGRVIVDRTRIESRTQSLDVSGFASGVYLLSAEFNGQVSVSTVILQ